MGHAKQPRSLRAARDRAPRVDEGEPVIRVLVVAPVRLYREGIEHALSHAADVEIVGSAETAAGGLAIVGEQSPDVVLIDVSAGNSVTDIAMMARAHPASKVVVMGFLANARDVIAYAEAGVTGYISPASSVDQIVAATKSAARGEAVCAPEIVTALLQRVSELGKESRPEENGARLTSRETEILALVNQGLSNKEIASVLTIELATVKNHMHNVFQKLQLNRRAEAAAWLRARGDIETTA